MERAVFDPERAAGLVLVLVLHAAALYGLMNARVIPVPDEVLTLFVETITTPSPPRAAELPKPARPEKPRPVEQPQPRQLVAEAPVVAPSEPVAPPPPPAPVMEAPPAPAPAPAPKPAGPLSLGTELAVSCPQRTPPAYPPLSRRRGEEGKVVLQVELDEQGAVSAARVAASSGFDRLDEAALNAVKSWRCTPASRDGQPVRAVALQPFKFILDGH
jgi:protein TonB